MMKAVQILVGFAALLFAAALVGAIIDPRVGAIVESLLKYSGRPLPYTSTPEVRDWASVRLRLTRSGSWSLQGLRSQKKPGRFMSRFS